MIRPEMISRIGNDVLRAVAVLGGLIVAGALLLSTADPRAAQFRFARTDLGPAGPSHPVAIALDGHPPGHVWATGVQVSERPLTIGSVSRALAYGDLAVGADRMLYAVSAGIDADDRDVMSLESGPGPTLERETTIETYPVPGSPPHVVVRADGLVVISGVADGRIRVWRSADGRAFSAGGEIPAAVAAAGPVIVGPFGSLFAGVVTPDGKIGVAASADGGKTWSARGVTTVSGVDRVPPSIAVDDAATLYVGFTTTVAGVPRVSIAYTRDLGLTWSPPVTAGPPGSHSPQLVAGSLGKVGLAYLDDGELVYRHTVEALLSQPFWTEHLVARDVVCAHPCERAPYEMTLSLRSRAVLAARSGERLIVAEQVSGSGVR